MNVQRIAFVVRGRVQGVGYRQFAAHAARRHGIAGFVRNDADGTVRGEAEGAADALGRFLEDLRRGPMFGRVDALEPTPQPTTGADGFRIER